MSINRRIFLGAAMASVAMPAWAAKQSLAEISAYLNKLTTAYATFTQHNSDGSRSTGQLFMQRPGRIRFEYAKPDDSIVIAGQGTVVLFDARSNDRPQEFQLQLTPLNLILGTDINLMNARMVVGHDFDGTNTIVTAQDPNHPEYGALRLVFAPGPNLIAWVSVDGAGSETTVVLGDLELGARMPARLFNVDAELAKRGF